MAMTNIKPGKDMLLCFKFIACPGASMLSILLFVCGIDNISRQPFLDKRFTDQSHLDRALVFLIIEIGPRYFAIPATIDFLAQALRHILCENPLFELGRSIVCCPVSELRNIAYRIGRNQYDIQPGVALFKLAQHFEFSGAILAIERPQDKNEGFVRTGCKHLLETSRCKRANAFRGAHNAGSTDEEHQYECYPKHGATRATGQLVG